MCRLGANVWIRCRGTIVALGTPYSILVTVFLIVLCANAVNFIDGLDGLASGVVTSGPWLSSRPPMLAHEQDFVVA